MLMYNRVVVETSNIIYLFYDPMGSTYKLIYWVQFWHNIYRLGINVDAFICHDFIICQLVHTICSYFQWRFIYFVCGERG